MSALRQYNVSVTQAAVADTIQMLEIILAGGSARRVGLTLLEMWLQTAVATQAAIVVPDAVGTSAAPVTPVNSCNITGAALGRVHTAWTVAPTFPGAPTYLQRLQPEGTAIGAIHRLTWPEQAPLIIGAGSSIVVRNITGGASAGVGFNIRWVEF